MYRIIYRSPAEKYIRKLDDFDSERLLARIEQLSSNPRLGKPLTANFSGLWSLRAGKYRVIYQIIDEELIVMIISVGHRKNIYC